MATATAVQIRPLEDRVIVSVDRREATTPSGLVIPDTVAEAPQQGTVVAVGPGRRSQTTGELLPPGVEAGDRVLFTTFAGTEITGDGEGYLIMAATDVLAVLG